MATWSMNELKWFRLKSVENVNGKLYVKRKNQNKRFIKPMCIFGMLNEKKNRALYENEEKVKWEKEKTQ